MALEAWKDLEDGALLLTSLEYLDVVSLIKKQPVCKAWKNKCIKAIDNKCKKKKEFKSNKELKEAVKKYSGYSGTIRIQSQPNHVELIAS